MELLDRDTPGIFQVWEDDMAEVREYPNGIHNVGGCEQEQLEETTLPDFAALGRVLVALYDAGGYTGESIQQDNGEFAEYLTFDLRSYLKPEEE